MFWKRNIIDNENRTHILHICIIVLLIVVIVVLAWRGWQRAEQLEAHMERLNNEVAQNESVVQETQHKLDTILENNKELRGQLAAAKKEQREAEQRIAQTQERVSQRLSSLQADLKSKVDEQTLSSLIDTWQHRVARVKCFITKDGNTKDAKGSAVAIIRNGALQFVTNRHLVKHDGYTLEECDLILPETDESFDVDGNDVEISGEQDVAYMRLDEQPSSVVLDAANVRSCSTKPSVGERVLILGYPKTGAEQGVTATEGIISGFEDEYYITSAKIEQGNSGGAAISVKNNCFVGMPTLVVVGRLESLARILPAPEF